MLLSAAEAASIQRSAVAAIHRYGLELRATAALSGPLHVGENETHVLPVEIWVERKLYPESEDEAGKGSTAQGSMCGNLLIIQYKEDEAYNTWTLTHELGHFLGLPHHDRTIMINEGNRAPRYNQYSECQEAIIGNWTSGAAYNRHWERTRRGECAFQDADWRAKFDFLRYAILGT